MQYSKSNFVPFAWHKVRKGPGSLEVVQPRNQPSGGDHTKRLVIQLGDLPEIFIGFQEVERLAENEITDAVQCIKLRLLADVQKSARDNLGVWCMFGAGVFSFYQFDEV